MITTQSGGFCYKHHYTTRIAGGLLFRTLRVLNWLKPLIKTTAVGHGADNGCFVLQLKSISS